MNNSPFDTKRAGAVKATIWENHNAKGQVYHTVVISRTYRDDEGDWKETNQLYADQLPLARLVADQAYACIHERLEELRSEGKDSAAKDGEEADKSAPAKKRGQKQTHSEKLLSDREKSRSAQVG